MTASRHIPVLLDEVVAWLNPRPGHHLVDGTLGGGGHAAALARRVEPGGWVLGLDRDPAALERAESELAGMSVRIAHSNYCDLPKVLEQIQTDEVDGILLDLGLSSDQLDDRERGFSFDSPGRLDLRFDATEGESAERLVNRLPEEQLANLIYRFGEERFSRRIARAIVERRRTRPFSTAQDLADVVRRSIPRASREDRLDPATRTFQALRIAVNDELSSLDRAIEVLPDCLRPGGRLAVISFHSLEDRRVKTGFREDPRLQVLTQKPIRPTPAEIARNPRSRSAKLRVAERTSIPRARPASH